MIADLMPSSIITLDLIDDPSPLNPALLHLVCIAQSSISHATAAVLLHISPL